MSSRPLDEFFFEQQQCVKFHKTQLSLPPTKKLRVGNVFTCVCLSDPCDHYS